MMWRQSKLKAKKYNFPLFQFPSYNKKKMPPQQGSLCYTNGQHNPRGNKPRSERKSHSFIQNIEKKEKKKTLL